MNGQSAERTPDDASAAATTVRPDEVALFTRLSGAWWDRHGEFAALHAMNPLRVGYASDHLARHFGRDPAAPRPLEGVRLLDVGCGGGLFSEPLARLGAEVTGIDATGAAIEAARAHAALSGLAIRYLCTAPEDLLRSGERFDAITAMEVVEHVADLGAFIAACAGLLAPGGALVASTLNRTLRALAIAKIGAEYIARMLAPGTHDWRRFVRPAELCTHLRRHDLRPVEVRGMTFDPLRRRWQLSADLRINYLLFAVRA